MLSLTDLFVMLLLCGLVASWMGLTAARERAVAQASRLCSEHDIQLLDQSVALSALRLYRHDGHLGFECLPGGLGVARPDPSAPSGDAEVAVPMKAPGANVRPRE